MSNIKKNHLKFACVDCQIWKKSLVDAKGRVVLPKKLRKKLCLNSKSIILWISARHKDGKYNEFILEVGIKNNENEVKKYG